MIEYRGFLIEVKHRGRDLRWCARWESLDGKVIRQKFDVGGQRLAVDHAKRKIDEYHQEIDRAKYPKVPV